MIFLYKLIVRFRPVKYWKISKYVCVSRRERVRVTCGKMTSWGICGKKFFFFFLKFFCFLLLKKIKKIYKFLFSPHPLS